MKVRSKRSAASVRQRESAQRQARENRKRLVMFAAGAALIAVVALIAGGALLRGGGEEVDIADRLAPAEGFILGEPNAPVLVTIWEDFQCPVCKQANSTVVAQIEEEYVNTGKARLQFRQFPFLGDESFWAAQASQCAADQDKFWPYHDALFAAQRGENRGAFEPAKLADIADDVGLDSDAFIACFNDDVHADSVAAEKQQGMDLGVNATPTFFVNGERVADWRDYDSLKAMIESALPAGS